MEKNQITYVCPDACLVRTETMELIAVSGDSEAQREDFNWIDW